jgi:hypothetical protein
MCPPWHVEQFLGDLDQTETCRSMSIWASNESTCRDRELFPKNDKAHKTTGGHTTKMARHNAPEGFRRIAAGQDIGVCYAKMTVKLTKDVRGTVLPVLGTSLRSGTLLSRRPITKMLALGSRP